jgi:hypothetical protein
MKHPGKREGKGMLSFGCFPRWRREGFTLLSSAENKRMKGKR